MAIGTPTSAVQFGDTTDATSWTSGSASVTADDALILCFDVANTGASETPPSVSSVSDGLGGLTWTQVENRAYANTSFNRMHSYVYRAVASSTTSGAVTVSLGGTAGGLHGQLVKISGCNTSNPVAQSAQAGGTATGGTVTLSAGSNPVILAIWHRANEFTTIGGSMTAELYDAGMATPAHSMEVAYATSFTASPSATWAGTTEWAGIAVELAEAAAPGAASAGGLMMRGVG